MRIPISRSGIKFHDVPKIKSFSDLACSSQRSYDLHWPCCHVGRVPALYLVSTYYPNQQMKPGLVIEDYFNVPTTRQWWCKTKIKSPLFLNYFISPSRGFVSHNTRPTMHHWKQKFARFYSEWCIARYGTGALCDLWDPSIIMFHYDVAMLLNIPWFHGDLDGCNDVTISVYIFTVNLLLHFIFSSIAFQLRIYDKMGCIYVFIEVFLSIIQSSTKCRMMLNWMSWPQTLHQHKPCYTWL